ncbi:hypothetical protein QBC34DRAFT_498938 [Podospora aff. communis PSN243]|uniref:Uncharacterized protein n=1 Tax=Podospora aff. communis PSN243 TaxID=3040156 RepID=A0AAV9G4B9_9PEZI|nr:hypothetical protein QBC34DRAFT_498938 [Podospora aff. communis PSN243]
MDPEKVQEAVISQKQWESRKNLANNAQKTAEKAKQQVIENWRPIVDAENAALLQAVGAAMDKYTANMKQVREKLVKFYASELVEQLVTVPMTEASRQIQLDLDRLESIAGGYEPVVDKPEGSEKEGGEEGDDNDDDQADDADNQGDGGMKFDAEVLFNGFQGDDAEDAPREEGHDDDDDDDGDVIDRPQRRTATRSGRASGFYEALSEEDSGDDDDYEAPSSDDSSSPDRNPTAPARLKRPDTPKSASTTHTSARNARCKRQVIPSVTASSQNTVEPDKGAIDWRKVQGNDYITTKYGTTYIIRCETAPGENTLHFLAHPFNEWNILRHLRDPSEEDVECHRDEDCGKYSEAQAIKKYGYRVVQSAPPQG